MAKTNEAKVRFTAETSGFNDEIKKSNKTMAELRAEMKLNEEQMKTNGESVEGLHKKKELLTEQLEASQSKTEALSKKLDTATKIYGENSDEVSKLRIQLMNAQSAEEKIRQQINNCNKALEKQADSAEDVEDAHESLTDKIKRQEGELEDLKGKYAEMVAQHGKNSREAKELAGEISDLSGELKENQFELSRAKKEADKLDKSIVEVDESTEEAGDGFTVFKGVLAGLITVGITSAIGAVKDLTTAFLNLAEETKETRTAFALLDGSFSTAGFGAEEARETIYDLQGVLGDTDRAMEASTLIAKMSKNEKDLETNTRILTGVWAEYNNAIPTEGLAEAMAATSAMGTVQGVLADALEWQGINLDKFNEKLGKMKTEEERTALIQETLVGLYGDSADAYRENNKALIESNNTQLEYNEALADLGEKAEPITTTLKQGFTDILKSVSDLLANADFEAIRQNIEDAFKWFIETGMPNLIQDGKDFIGWLKETVVWIGENKGLMIGLGAAIGVISTAVGLLNVAKSVKLAMDAAEVTSIGALIAAHWAQAAAGMAALAPYLLIVAAIAAVIAIIVVCIKYWDEIVAAVKNAWQAICDTMVTWGEWIYGNVIQPVADFFAGLWDKFISGAKDAWAGVKSVFSKVGKFFSDIFNTVKDKIVSVFQAGGTVFNNIKDGIVSVFKTVVNGIIKGINTVVSLPFKGLNKILDKIHGVSVAGVTPFSWLTWRAPIPEIPLLAKGGILTKPTLNIAGEAGPEAIIPIDKLEWFISGAVEKALQTANLQALAYAVEDLAKRPINLNINGRTYAQAIASDSDAVSGQRNIFVTRGLAL